MPAPRAAPAAPAAPCPTLRIDGETISGRERGYLGVEPTALSSELRRHFGVDESAGVLVAQVTSGSAAERAGIRVGDILTHVQGPGEAPRAIDTPWTLGTVIADRAGEPLQVKLWRDGSPLELSVLLDARERCAFDLAAVMPHLLEEGVDFDFDEFDFDMFDMDPEALRQLSLTAAAEAMRALEAVDWEQQAEALRQLEDLEIRSLELEGLEEHMEQLEIEMERLHDRLEEADEARLEALESQLEARAEAVEAAREAQLEAAEEALEAQLEARMEANEARVEAAERAAEAQMEAREALEEQREAAEARRERSRDQQ